MAARFGALAAACALLASCSNSGKVDSKYGVSSSARVVAPGQPVPKGGGAYRVGNPYVVAGRTYVPEENINYSAEGMASWYGDDFHGRYTANGEVFDMNSISAAHPTLPMPSYVRVTNMKNHKSLVVRVNDRGPFSNNRIIDLSVQSAKLLGFHGHGLTKVKVEYVGRAPLAGSDDRKLMATLRDGDRPAKPAPVLVASAGTDYVPAMFDSRPLTQVPGPQRRPAARGEGEAEASAGARRSTVELAANARTPAVQSAPLDPPAASPQTRLFAEPSPSPVSAYAPTRYDAPARFLNGRGLY
ncbi:MAG: septal ring lytic transglycosylase RlpA family protein [Pseudolabrys sp.]